MEDAPQTPSAPPLSELGGPVTAGHPVSNVEVIRDALRSMVQFTDERVDRLEAEVANLRLAIEDFHKRLWEMEQKLPDPLEEQPEQPVEDSQEGQPPQEQEESGEPGGETPSP